VVGVREDDRGPVGGVKILADQKVSRKVVDKLRAAGLDVVRVGEALNPRASDVDILAEAERRGAIILSHDQDFSTLLAASGMARPSLVNLRVSYVDADQLSRVIISVLRSTGEDLDAGAVVTVDDTRVRIRRLPIG
jgi:predicted nuclease of predicted toxin-antitoxin system